MDGKTLYNNKMPASTEYTSVLEKREDNVIGEMASSLADLQVSSEEDKDPALKVEEEDECFNIVEVDIVETDIFDQSVDESAVDPLDLGEEPEGNQVSERKKKLERLKKDIEKVKQNLKYGKEEEPKKAKKNLNFAKVSSDDEKMARPQRFRFRPGQHPCIRKFPGVPQPPTLTKKAEPVVKNHEDDLALQSVESKNPFPVWPEEVGGAVEAERKARREKLRQMRIIRKLRRTFHWPKIAKKQEQEQEQEEENEVGLTDEPQADVGEGEGAPPAEETPGKKRCSHINCKKKVGLTDFACRFGQIQQFVDGEFVKISFALFSGVA